MFGAPHREHGYLHSDHGYLHREQGYLHREPVQITLLPIICQSSAFVRDILKKSAVHTISSQNLS